MNKRLLTVLILVIALLMNALSGCLGTVAIIGGLNPDVFTEPESEAPPKTESPSGTEKPTEPETEPQTETEAPPETVPGGEVDEEEMAAFREFTDEILEFLLVGSTLNLHTVFAEPEKAGITMTEVKLPSLDFENGATEEYNDFIRDCLAELADFDREKLDEEAQITYDSLKRYLELEKESAGLDLYYDPLTKDYGLPTNLPIEFEEYAFYRESDVQDYLELLGLVPDLFREILDFEEKRADAGLFMEDFLLEKAIDQCDTFLEGKEDSFLFSSFEARLEALDLSEEKKQAYVEENRKLVSETFYPAYEELKEGLVKFRGRNETEGGLCNFPDGERYYTYLLKSKTGSDMSPEEMIERLERALNEDMTRVVLVNIDDPNAVNIILREDYYPTTDLKECLEILKEKMKDDFPEIPDVSYKVRYLDESLREFMSPAFYMIPPIDRSVDNSIVVNCDPGDEPEDILITLAHEGYPGHLYQNNYFVSRCHFPLQRILETLGFAEGYAKYVEHLSYDYIDGISEAEAKILRLNARLVMYLYARVDLGIHYEGWTEDQIADYIEPYLESPEYVAEWMYEHMLGDPASYEPYVIGELEILDILDAAEDAADAAGEEFDLKAFHEKLLNVSYAPFGVIREYILGRE